MAPMNPRLSPLYPLQSTSTSLLTSASKKRDSDKKRKMKKN